MVGSIFVLLCKVELLSLGLQVVSLFFVPYADVGGVVMSGFVPPSSCLKQLVTPRNIRLSGIFAVAGQKVINHHGRAHLVIAIAEVHIVI